jgi:E3 ubiquitin-protein ligase RNF115/126
MENGNSTRPAAASQDVIEQLPREVLEIGCMLILSQFPSFPLTTIRVAPTLEKDCAVCKDQFKLETEDPEEQVVISLPCKHTFHEGCIIPWLKSSGTCPVCRYEWLHLLEPVYWNQIFHLQTRLSTTARG